MASQRKITLQGRSNAIFPHGSLLAAMSKYGADIEARRAVSRLRSAGGPAVAVDGDIADLASGLAASEVSRSPAVLEFLPPLFWMEAERESGPDVRETRGWVVEKKPGGLAAKGFRLPAGRDAAPEAGSILKVSFGAGSQDEDGDTQIVRGLLTAISLPEMMAQMGEHSPVLLLPAEASDVDSAALRGFRLSVAVSPDSAPD